MLRSRQNLITCSASWKAWGMKAVREPRGCQGSKGQKQERETKEVRSLWKEDKIRFRLHRERLRRSVRERQILLACAAALTWSRMNISAMAAA